MFEICVLGHITKDIIKIGNLSKEMVGGTVYYTSLPLKSLGAKVAVVTKLAKKDRDLLIEIERENIPIFLKEGSQTTIFINAYKKGLSERKQWVKEIAPAFRLEEVKEISAKIFHLGPLTKNEIPFKIIKFLASKGKISLDVQGFLREILWQNQKIKRGEIKLVDWKEKAKILPFVSILHASEEEARILTGKTNLGEMAKEISRYGPEEIIITNDSKGSLIYSKGKFYSIPAFLPKKLVDATGCGDTYMAGYLFQRIKSSNIKEAGRFAAALSALKLEKFGPFKGNLREVEAFLKFQS